MSQPDDACSNCGAPRTPGYAACRYCKTPFVKDTQTGAIPCPRCNTLNELGAQKCVQCQAWVVVQCVFCKALSPHNLPACQSCHEPFAGAPERFQERQRQQHLQQGLDIASSVANVAAPLVGALAGAALVGSHSSYGYREEHHHRHHEGFSGGGGGGFFGGGEEPPPPPYVDQGYGDQGPDIAPANTGGGGFWSSLLGGGDSSEPSGAGIAESSDRGSSWFGGDDDSGGAGISESSDSSDSGTGLWDSSDDDDS